MAPARNLQSTRVNAYSLASLYLRTAHLPDTAVNRRILAAWFMAESKRVGSDVIIYNYNPLNYTCASCSDANTHQFEGNGHRFANYGGYTAGAQAWAQAMNRSIYAPIRLAFQFQSANSFYRALGSAPWGTNNRTWLSVQNGLPSGSTYGPFVNLDDNSTFGGYGGTDTGGTIGPPVPMLGGFYVNGTPMLVKPIGSTFSRDDAKLVMQKLNAAGVFNADGPVGWLTGAVAANQFEAILYHHDGEKWNAELLAKIAAETGVAAVNANPGNALHDALPDAGDLLGLDKFVDPTKLPADLFHIFGILLGTGLILYGVRVIFRSAGVEGISAGEGSYGEGDYDGQAITDGSEGGTATIIQPNVIDVKTVPAFIEGPPPSSVRSQPITRRRGSKIVQWPEPVPDFVKGEGNTYGSASSATAPLKKVAP